MSESTPSFSWPTIRPFDPVNRAGWGAGVGALAGAGVGLLSAALSKKKNKSYLQRALLGGMIGGGLGTYGGYQSGINAQNQYVESLSEPQYNALGKVFEDTGWSPLQYEVEPMALWEGLKTKSLAPIDQSFDKSLPGTPAQKNTLREMSNLPRFADWKPIDFTATPR